MSLESYIQGQRRGIAVNRLEREAMQDPFLSDALEGYDTIKGNHAERIEELQTQILKRNQTHSVNFKKIGIILFFVLLLGGVCAYFYLCSPSFGIGNQTDESPMIEEPISAPIDTPDIKTDTEDVILSEDTIVSAKIVRDSLIRRPVKTSLPLDDSVFIEIIKPVAKLDSVEVIF